MVRHTIPGRYSNRGFTYLMLMFAIALMGIAMAVVGTVWHTEQKRAKEKELLFIGHEFRNAIGEYYEKSPGTVKKYPQSLKDLILDKRYLTIHRYLRHLYRDPMTNSDEWGLVEGPDHGITGIYSLSKDAPVKIANFDDVDKTFAGSKQYSDWKFIYVPKEKSATTASKPNPSITARQLSNP